MATNWHLGSEIVPALLVVGLLILLLAARLMAIAIGVGVVGALVLTIASSLSPADRPPHSPVPAATASPAPTPSPRAPASSLPPPAEIGVCADGSRLVGRPLVAAFLERLASGVSAWPASPIDDYRDGSPPQPGLHLVVRNATDRSAHRDPRSALDAYIDGVPGIPPRPDVDDPRYLDEEPLWADAVRAMEAARVHALQQAAEAADAIRHLRVPAGVARVADCLLTVAGDLLPHHRLLATLTSLRPETAAPTGDLGPSAILVGQACPDTDACSTETAWSQVAALHRASAVHVVPSDLFLDVLTDFLRGSYP